MGAMFGHPDASVRRLRQSLRGADAERIETGHRIRAEIRIARHGLAVEGESIDLAALVRGILRHRQRRIVAFAEMTLADGQVQMALAIDQQAAAVMEALGRTRGGGEQRTQLGQAIIDQARGGQAGGEAVRVL